MHRQLSDLVPILDSPDHEGNIILGGDLNITTPWTGEQRRYRDWETSTFARIAAFGLADCMDIHRAAGPWPGRNCDDGDACRHIQTQRHARSTRPWQNDYLFASTQLVSADVLTSAGVHDSVSVQRLGDHMPLVAEFLL